jgi:hypothetical protein
MVNQYQDGNKAERRVLLGRRKLNFSVINLRDENFKIRSAARSVCVVLKWYTKKIAHSDR